MMSLSFPANGAAPKPLFPPSSPSSSSSDGPPASAGFKAKPAQPAAKPHGGGGFIVGAASKPFACSGSKLLGGGSASEFGFKLLSQVESAQHDEPAAGEG